MFIILMVAFVCIFIIGISFVFYGYNLIPMGVDEETQIINEAQGNISLFWFGVGLVLLIISAIALAAAVICKLLA